MNRLIHGDCTNGLKAIGLRNEVKCICIDPPYNTGGTFAQYDDNESHADWLLMMQDQIQLCHRALAMNGSLWIIVDDNELHYLKVMCDGIFGRKNYVTTIAWQKAYSPRMDSQDFSRSIDFILVYQKSDLFSPNSLPFTQNKKQFNHFDSRRQVYYRRRQLRKEGSKSSRSDSPGLFYGILAPDNTLIYPIKSSGEEGVWRWAEKTYLGRMDQIEWVMQNGGWKPYTKQYYRNDATKPPETLWLAKDVGHNHEAKIEAQAFGVNTPFATPKPERLIARILQIATHKDDLVMDTFAGSGTTGAVAHKLARQWVMIEKGDQIHTHIQPRMNSIGAEYEFLSIL